MIGTPQVERILRVERGSAKAHLSSCEKRVALARRVLADAIEGERQARERVGGFSAALIALGYDPDENRLEPTVLNLHVEPGAALVYDRTVHGEMYVDPAGRSRRPFPGSVVEDNSSTRPIPTLTKPIRDEPQA